MAKVILQALHCSVSLILFTLFSCEKGEPRINDEGNYSYRLLIFTNLDVNGADTVSVLYNESEVLRNLRPGLSDQAFSPLNDESFKISIKSSSGKVVLDSQFTKVTPNADSLGLLFLYSATQNTALFLNPQSNAPAGKYKFQILNTEDTLGKSMDVIFYYDDGNSSTPVPSEDTLDFRLTNLPFNRLSPVIELPQPSGQNGRLFINMRYLDSKSRKSLGRTSSNRLATPPNRVNRFFIISAFSARTGGTPAAPIFSCLNNNLYTNP
jgi:hypothetical protein